MTLLAPPLTQTQPSDITVAAPEAPST